MPEMIAQILTALETGNLFVLMVGGPFALIFFFERLKRFSMDVRDRNTSFFKDNLDTSELDEDVRKIISEKINRDVFYQATGLSGDKHIRSEVRQVLECSDGAFTIAEIKRIGDYTGTGQEGLVIELKGWHWFKYWFDRVWVWLLLGCIPFAMVELWWLWNESSWSQKAQSIALMIGLFLIAAITAKTKRNYEIAKEIHKVLVEIKSQNVKG